MILLRTIARLADEFLAKYSELRGKRIVLFLGRLHPKKGLDLLLPAFELSASARLDLRLVLAGPCEGAYSSHLKQLASRLNISERVAFVGAQEGAQVGGACRRRNFCFTILPRKLWLGGRRSAADERASRDQPPHKHYRRYRDRKCRTRLRTYATEHFRSNEFTPR